MDYSGLRETFKAEPSWTQKHEEVSHATRGEVYDQSRFIPRSLDCYSPERWNTG